MRRVLSGWLAVLFVFGSLLAPLSPAVHAEPHPLIRRAVNALQAARRDLQNAAHDYCGHRAEALEATNAALAQLQKALQCDSKKGSSAGAEFTAEAEPMAAGAGEPHPNIYRAVNALGVAEGDLQNAAHDYCGHLVEALEATRAALNQLKAAIQCDKK